MTNEPPLSAEAVLDFVQAMGAQTSESQGHRELAGWVQHKLDEFFNDSTLDATGRTFLREVAFAAASTIRGFAVERTAFKGRRAREQRVDELRQQLLAPRFFFSATGGERINVAYAIALKALGPAVLAGFAAMLPTWVRVAAFPVALLWVMFGDIVTAYAVVWVQERAFRNAGNVADDVHKTWGPSLPRYKALAVDLLARVERLRERYYPASAPLVPGIQWSAVPAGDLDTFLRTPHSSLSSRRPIDVLSAIVDLHFSLDAEIDPRYVAPGARGKLA